MIVNFKMVINDEIIQFKSIGKLTNNILQFKDMNNKQNTILIEISTDMITIEQFGETNMKNIHILNKVTTGFYQGKHNVNGITKCDTTKLVVEENSIEIIYDFYFNDELASSNKLNIFY